MKTFTAALTPPYEKAGLSGEGLCPSLSCIIHDTDPDRTFPAVIAVPGGSYEHCSKREGEPCAARWYSHGFNSFVPEYSCVDKPFPTALLELAAAVEYIRKNKDSLRCNGDIILCGFSAGGHLCASLGVHHERYAELFSENIRPDKMVLCYPVITAGDYTHPLSAKNIAPTDELKALASLEAHVSEATPPAFIWHCADDRVVPVENSLMFAAAMSRNNRPFELHIFPEGGHGIAMCDITTVKNNDPRYINKTAARWFELALDWVNRSFTNNQ
ncbi:MAG: alpha/beta hydrolase [Oscillospiraceae bacterium]|nr:alpha/beta hydrolase [Oscillospiraceae bacterium]